MVSPYVTPPVGSPPAVRAVLFDAAGTLIFPRPAVEFAYRDIGQKYGSRLTASEIQQRFRQALATVPDDGRTNEGRERRRWQSIVAQVFAELPQADQGLFEELWEHFAQAHHWRLYSDVESVWEHLSPRGMILGIASNFDSRLRRLCRELPPLSAASQVFCSSELGYCKPHREFFQAVERALGLAGPEILLVGDSQRHDLQGAQAAGWRALLLRRNDPSDRQSIQSLAQLPSLLHQPATRTPTS